MRRSVFIIAFALIAGFTAMALPAHAAKTKTQPAQQQANTQSNDGQVEVTADQSLEYYQDKRIYVARGNAKAVRGDMVVEADLLTAHQREKPQNAAGQQAAAQKTKSSSTSNSPDSGTGDIDIMTAEGHVRVTDPERVVHGDKAVYDLDKHYAIVTGNNLRYETEKDTVTARDSLEYWEDKKMAVARGHAVAISGDRHVEADILTTESRDAPNGQSQMNKMTALGHVTVITKTDVSRGDKAVYDGARNIAIMTGNVRITRSDGTQLSGDVGEVDFANNQSRLLNQGSGRVRALLTSKDSGSSSASPLPGAVATSSTAGSP